MKYGKFSKDGKEFLIDNVETPTPWINYLYNGRYFSTISNNGGGISYYKSPLHGRITRYRINDVPHDRPGKFIYVKDEDTKDIWSLTWQPVGVKRESYKIIHGFGYTKSEAKVKGIKSSVLFFVPKEDDCEIWKTTLTNKSNKARKLTLTAYVEFALGHAMVDIINQCDDQHFNRVYFDKGMNSLFATKTYWVTSTMGTQQQENKEWDQWVYFTSNCPVKSYETMRERFIGNYRNENNPIAIEQDAFSNKDTDYGNAVGAIQIEVELQPDETKEVVFTLGVIEKEKFNELKTGIVGKYNNIKLLNSAFEQLKNEWDNYFAYTSVNTPDEQANIFMNYWTPYQAKVAYDVGRVASFYYWGISRGFGFRDTAQDTIAVTISNPEKAKDRICLLARQMYSDGKAFHHFYADGQGELTKHADDPLWFILAVTDYIKQTGDISLLDKVEPFVDNKEGTILDHLFAVVNFAANNIGVHNLPIFGRGDWNDTLDYIGGEKGGESVWAAMFYAAMLNYLKELLLFINKTERIDEVEFVKKRLVDSLEEYCWDGEWYIRAFDGDNNKIGSHTNKYGKIFINTQSWPVLAGLPDKERLLKSLDSAKRELDTEFGPKICAPAFREINPKIGLITRCVWGKKENGAVFCHPTTWLIQAETLMRRGNIAFDYYKKLLPNAVDEDIFKAEPYVYSQYITSDEHESAGRASHSWQTGTAAWMFRVCLDHIIGVRATYSGLLIDPVVPSGWKEFSCQRIFRGTKYIINITNPDGVESGVKKIIVDGEEISGTIIPVSKKKKCKVEVIMGNK